MTTSRDLLGLSTRGLPGALPSTRPAMDVRSIRIDAIDPDPEQPRKVFREESIDELAGSIRESGLLQPIRVRPDASRPGRYVLIAGERRLRAAHRVPLVEIAAIVVEQRQGDERTRVEQAIENLQREDLSAVEEGQNFRNLLKAWGCSQAELARKLSKSAAHISKMLAVADLDEETKAAIVSGKITYGDALRERDRRLAAAEAKPVPRARRRATPRGTVSTPFGSVKIKRGKTLAELVEYLRGLVDQEKRDAA